MTIGEKINYLRVQSEMTTQELGMKCGCSQSTISTYENGKVKNIDQNILLKIANALGTDTIYLSSDSGDVTSSERRKIEAGKIGRIISHLRKENHMKQSELAETLDIDQPLLSKIESGCIDIKDENYTQVYDSILLLFPQLSEYINNIHNDNIVLENEERIEERKDLGKMTTGEKITKLRTEMGLKQRELADKIGTDKATISSYERDMIKSRNQNIMIKMAKVFGIDVSDLNDEADAASEKYLIMQGLKDIGNSIKKERTSANITQKSLGVLIGLSSTTISKIESGFVDIRIPSFKEHLSKLIKIYPNLDNIINGEIKVEECDNNVIKEMNNDIKEEVALDEVKSIDIENIKNDIEPTYKEEVKEDIIGRIFDGFEDIADDIVVLLYDSLMRDIETIQYGTADLKSLEKLKIKIEWYGKNIADNKILKIKLQRKIDIISQSPTTGVYTGVGYFGGMSYNPNPFNHPQPSKDNTTKTLNV